jgi:ribonuclease HI
MRIGNGQASPSATRQGPRAQRPRWISPPAGVMKLNVDAAISKNTLKSASAVVARDDKGTFLGASVMVRYGITDPETMEIMACNEGLALTADLLLSKIRLACDNISAIRNIYDGGLNPYGQIVREIKARASSFVSCDFVHENRASNTDAHNLARSTVGKSLGRHVWLVTPPVGVSVGVCTSCYTTDQ